MRCDERDDMKSDESVCIPNGEWRGKRIKGMNMNIDSLQGAAQSIGVSFGFSNIPYVSKASIQCGSYACYVVRWTFPMLLSQVPRPR